VVEPFHLAWFLSGSNVQGWGRPWTGAIGRDWMKPDLYVDIARALERAGFDYILLEDNVYVPDNYGGSMEIYLKNALVAPRMDPATLSPLLLQATSRIGIVPTISTFAYHPYLMARQVGTLDMLSGGRAGWNMVTGSSDLAVQNFGFDAMEEHDQRYEMATEFVDCANALWDSWEPDAIVADPVSGVFADHTKVHTVDFEGRWYQSRGPLNSGPAPQGRPVLAQAGNSPRGQRFAAEYADTVVGQAGSIERMKAFRDDVRALAAGFGRNPDHVKILYIASPTLGASEAEAEARLAQKEEHARERADLQLAQLAKMTSIDFGSFPLDEPLSPETPLETNGTRAVLDDFLKRNEGRTLREAAAGRAITTGPTRFAGTPDSVAGEMCEVMEEVGGDGFLLAGWDVSRRTIAEIADGLVPALQRRGVVRKEYAHEQFRDNLLEY
jgi:FMN-dependent oxidoreductase (nitrilotriacetate monooxygenase family)